MYQKVRYEILMWINQILKFIPGKIGCIIRKSMLPVKSQKNVLIWDNVHIDSPAKLIIGENTSINRGCIINCGGGVTIGKNVLIAPNVIIYSQNHSYLNIEIPINQQGYTKKEVIIKDNVWLAVNVVVLPGSIINENVVVGASSLVRGTLESGYLYAGNPIKKIRRI